MHLVALPTQFQKGKKEDTLAIWHSVPVQEETEEGISQTQLAQSIDQLLCFALLDPFAIRTSPHLRIPTAKEEDTCVKADDFSIRRIQFDDNA